MKKLFKIEAEIYISAMEGRTWPIKTGYRPGFNFNSKSLVSGSIDLLERESLHPGDKGIVVVSFISDELLVNVKPDIEFSFFEGPVEIGKGKVLKVLGWMEKNL